MVRSLVESYINCTVSHVQYGSCFCLCHTDFNIECSCPDVNSCTKCQRECAPANTKSCLSLGKNEPAPGFEFVTEKEEQERENHTYPLTRKVYSVGPQSIFGVDESTPSVRCRILPCRFTGKVRCRRAVLGFRSSFSILNSKQGAGSSCLSGFSFLPQRTHADTLYRYLRLDRNIQ